MSGVVDSLNRSECIIGERFNSLDCKVVQDEEKKVMIKVSNVTA